MDELNKPQDAETTSQTDQQNQTAANAATKDTILPTRKTPKAPAVAGKAASKNDSGRIQETGKDTGVDTASEGKGAEKEGNTNQSKVTEKCKSIAREVFAGDDRYKVLHFTADLVPFADKRDAEKHAATQKDTDIITIEKEK